MTRQATVQAQHVTYELESLGWKAFQDLCSTIISEVLGQTVQSFLSSRDGGRDGAFHGTWTAPHGAGISGSFTVQCKFTSRKNASLSLADLEDELHKARRLAARGLADNYILMTNHSVSGRAEEDIRDAFLAIKGIRSFLPFGAEWITLKIRESSRLRMLVPRVYGLGDLSQILDERAYGQAREILSWMGDDLAKFVITDAHRKAANALIKPGFVLLLGEPASGKSTIAATLALGALDWWDCSTLKVRNAEEFVQHWNSNEPHQFFWVDDAFGALQYQRPMANDWSTAFPHMSAAIKKGTKILFTSRDYIYRAAEQDLKTTAFPLMRESQVIIQVQKLTDAEKAQILYNHIKLGDQPNAFKTQVKPFLPGVAASPRFLPEVARRLGGPLFTKNLPLSVQAITDFVERPLAFMVDVIRNLDCECRAALALIFMREGLVRSPMALTKEESEALECLGATKAGVREALKAMNGSLVRFIKAKARRWTFRHPTIGDALAEVIAEDPELVDIYLAGVSPDKLLSEVTCGAVGIQGARLVVPPRAYDLVLRKLDRVKELSRVFWFLSYRSDRDFIARYLERHPEATSRICAPRSYLSACVEVSLVCHLHEWGLLPEEERLRFVAEAKKLAVDTPDADFLTNPRIRAVLSDLEVLDILASVRWDLIEDLPCTIDVWLDNYERSEDPESYFEPLKGALSAYRRAFRADPAAVRLLDKGLAVIDGHISDLESDEKHEDFDDDAYEPSGSPARWGKRDIFDDVDE